MLYVFKIFSKWFLVFIFLVKLKCKEVGNAGMVDNVMLRENTGKVGLWLCLKLQILTYP